MNIKNRIAELNNELIGLRRDFHMYPELGFEEYRTAEKIEKYLISIGLKPERVAKTGVVATLQGNNSGSVILLRADIDALPIQEENNVQYKSKNPGCMHACGHDAHTAMLLAAAKVLTEQKDKIYGTIKFVFQPNEEVAGAEEMISQGVMENPRPDAAMAMHIWTQLPSGIMGIKQGAVMASMDVFKITVKGKGGHTGYPEKAIDPIIAASSVIQILQVVQTRQISLMQPTVIMFGSINGGVKSNIIPDEVVLEGTVRYLYEGKEDNPSERLKQLVESVCLTHHCSCEIEIHRENYAVVNNPEMVELARATALKVLGDDRKIVEHASMASEDFSSFSSRVPGIFAFLGAADPEKETDFPHHNPRFNIDEDVLGKGVEFFVEGALAYLNRQSSKES